MMLWPQLNQFKRCLVSGLCGNGQRLPLRPSLTGAPCHLAAAADLRQASNLGLLSLGGFFFSMTQPERNSPQSRHLPCALGDPGLPPGFHSDAGYSTEIITDVPGCCLSPQPHTYTLSLGWSHLGDPPRHAHMPSVPRASSGPLTCPGAMGRLLLHNLVSPLRCQPRLLEF